MVIEFGDWQLRKSDERNWELYHRHETGDTTTARKAGTVGDVKWHGCHRYYQYNTIHLALRYAADWELRNEYEGVAADVPGWLDEYERITDGYRDAILSQLAQMGAM